MIIQTQKPKFKIPLLLSFAFIEKMSKLVASLLVAAGLATLWYSPTVEAYQLDWGDLDMVS